MPIPLTVERLRHLLHASIASENLCVGAHLHADQLDHPGGP